MTIEIREAAEADADKLVLLIAVLAGENGETTSLTAAYARQYLATPGQGVLLVLAGGEPVGLLSYSLRQGLYHAASSLVIEDLVIMPAFRRRGLAKRLVGEAVALARTNGCAEISVSTGLDNLPAQALYRGEGLADESLLLEKHFASTK